MIKASLICAWMVCIGNAINMQAWAHPISLSSTIVNVHAHRIEVEIEIMLEDLVLFHQLKANGEMKYSSDDLKSASQKHRQFLLDYFTILEANGQRLPGKIQNANLDQIDLNGVAQTDMLRRSVRYELVYVTREPQPLYLTFMQNFGGDSAALPALMDLHVLQEDTFVEKSTQIVHGRPHTIQLDWKRKREGGRMTFADLRKKHAEQLQDRLGISSYTALFSFLYITRFEVRHEILIPLLTLEKWVPIDRTQSDFLEVDEQLAAHDAIEKFFKERSLVFINQQPVEAKLSRLSFFGLDINDFALNAEPRRVGIHQARVGVILTFPAIETPKIVTVKWNTFSEYAPYVQSVVLVGSEAPKQHTFQSLQTTYDWSGDLIGPTVEPVRAESTQLDQPNRSKILQQVFANIYRAFDFRSDEEVYDALASSVDGNLLRELYLRIKRTLLMAEQGGAVSQVTAVEVVSATPITKGTGATFESTWRVTGVTEHWGHVHRRVSEFRAQVTLGRHDGFWKLEKFQLLDEKRIQFETSIRGYDPS